MFSSKSKEVYENLEMESICHLKIPPARECVYASCYCEENVWKLCEQVRNHQRNLLTKCYAVFISNRNQSVPLWCQRSGDEPNNLAVWDYHVIFIYQSEDSALVYDLDTVLPFPVSFEKYVSCTFQGEFSSQSPYYRYFRVIPAIDFLKTFASDRSRMKNPDGSWKKEPPPYPCLTTSETTNNIEDFISMDPCVGIGEVLDTTQFIEKFL